MEEKKKKQIMENLEKYTDNDLLRFIIVRSADIVKARSSPDNKYTIYEFSWGDLNDLLYAALTEMKSRLEKYREEIFRLKKGAPLPNMT